MKYEIEDRLPDYLFPIGRNNMTIFSHFEFACGIPQLVFAVTTNKENESRMSARSPGVPSPAARRVITPFSAG